MGPIEVWVALNAVTIAATTGLAVVNGARFRRAAARRALPAGKRSLLLLRRRNYNWSRANLLFNLGVAGLGAAMVATALTWGGAVPAFVLWGTGAFTAIWVGWAAVGTWDWWATSRVAEQAEQGD